MNVPALQGCASEVGYFGRDTWDLLLPDGARIPSVDTLGIDILPGDTAATRLHYPLPQDVELAGG